jgi:hypothetical protein
MVFLAIRIKNTLGVSVHGFHEPMRANIVVGAVTFGQQDQPSRLAIPWRRVLPSAAW